MLRSFFFIDLEVRMLAWQIGRSTISKLTYLIPKSKFSMQVSSVLVREALGEGGDEGKCLFAIKYAVSRT